MAVRRYRATIVRWVNGKEVREETEFVDMTMEDLERGLTPEEIAADRADLNIETFCRMLAADMKLTSEAVQE
jgi:hypothetical protein